MVKILCTGDLHIGRTYDRFAEVRDRLISSRFECLDRMVKEAEKRGCSVFVVTGDTFEKVSAIKVSDVKRVVGILAAFSGTVLVLPGNHDYYGEDVKLWKDFFDAMGKVEHNIIVMNEFKPIEIEAGDEKVRFYPAYCHDKHSSENSIGWIKESRMDTSFYNVGVAHGAIEGVTPDTDKEYYLMTESELNDAPVDLWLLGHTHIPYPALEAGREYRGYKIFNAGTPEQLDYHNNTEGYAYEITLDRENGNVTVTADAFHSGSISLKEEVLDLFPEEKALENKLREIAEKYDSNSVINVTLKGTVKQEEYDRRGALCNELLSGLLIYELDDARLSPQITKEKIYAEFPEFGFAARLLENLMDRPEELQMAYDILKECKE